MCTVSITEAFLLPDPFELHNKIKLLTTDLLALASMKNVAKCDTWCELQNPANHRVFERKLRPRPSGRGHVCLGVTPKDTPNPTSGRDVVFGPPCRRARWAEVGAAGESRRAQHVVGDISCSRCSASARGRCIGPKDPSSTEAHRRSDRDPRSVGTTR